MARWLLLLALALAAGGVRAGPADPPRCPPAQAARCVPRGRGDSVGEYTYTVDGMHLLIEYSDGGYYALQCSGNLTLDNPAIPRFESQLRVFKAQLMNCPAPSGPYGAVLQRLNVSVSDKLKLASVGKLSAAHLADLGDLHALELINAELAPRTLAALVRLRRLILDNIRLPPDELRQLPTSLQMLELMRMGTDVSRDVLSRLPNLVKVTVRDSSNVSVAVGGALQVLALEMPAARVPSALSPTLRSLTVLGWAERSPAPWSACALDTLNLNYVTAEELPAQWVSACANLSVLHVQYGSHLRALHATSLHGAPRLRELRLTSCALEALPAGLLDDAVELSVLDLSGNFLKELPSGLFVRTRSLHTLNLSKNRLTTDVYSSLKAVTSLSWLTLSYNDLRDSCGGAGNTVRGVSPLESLKNLTYLDLRNTNASLICRDWRENIPLLTTLDLSRNNFTTLTYADLQFRGKPDLMLDLSRNNVRKLQYTKLDYQLATGTVASSRAVVTLGDSLVCDCEMYWAVRALQVRPAHVKSLSAKCARDQEPRDLQSVAVDSLVCAAPELCVGAWGCVCAWRNSGVEVPARVLRVSCERAGLTRLADVLAPLTSAARLNHVSLDDYDWQLYLAHNRITDLNATDIPKHLSVLDLRNNSLSVLNEDAMRALLADKRRHVLLEHNKLACNCSAYDALTVMSEHKTGLDYDALTCADGSRLSRARLSQCATSRGLSAGVVAATAVLVTLLAAAALAGLLRHPALRLRLKERGWLPAHAEPDDDKRRFDVFLSFSHGDERFVRDELVARLESGPAPYRLCVHYRDWVPGGWIPAQIAASVRASRRTVAVVSAHFLHSAWARAEFQEAYALALRDARPRLVVVLLDDPAALPLDDKLRSYLATNTYVRWGDPWFWQKLRLALPRSRGPVPVEMPPAPADPPIAGEVCSEPSAGEVCSEPSAALALNSPQSSSCSSSNLSASSSCSSASSSSSADSIVELRRLITPASCGAQLHNAGPVFPSAGAVPV